jgi:hypothetical protein
VTDHTNENLPSDVKVTRRDNQVILKFRTATVTLTREGAHQLANALKEIA